MVKSKAVHECLFCQQTFDSAADKEEHILAHFSQEQCTECNENLIRIGGYLYVRHNEVTCIKKAAISKENVESCTSTESIQTTPESHTLARNVHSLDTAHTPQIKTEPKDFDESMSATSGNEMTSSILVGGLPIQSRFSNVNLNPVVVLEDILMKKDTVRPPVPKHCKTETESNLQNSLLLKIQKHKCHTCSMTFKRREYLVDHMTIHTGKKPYLCTYEHCKERFRTRSHRYHHVLSKHAQGKTSVCGVNGREKTFSTEGSFELHGDKEHNTPTTNYSCYICSEVFNVKANLVEHIQKKHEALEICNTEEQSIEQVEPQFEQSVFSHQQKKDSLNGIKIKIKGETVLVGSQSNDHEWNGHDDIVGTQNLSEYNKVPYHKKMRVFTCEICKKQFTKHFDLRMHVRSHHVSKVKKFKCNVCSRAFTQNFTLTQHKKIHTNERQFKCSYEHCNKRFINRWSRVRHERMHTGEKPYACDIDGCKRAFANNGALKKHVEGEHGISKLNYSCDICLKICHTKLTLTKHIKEKHSTFEIRNTEEQQIETNQQQNEQSIVSNHQEEDNLTEANFEIKVEELSIEPQANESNSQQEINHEWIDDDRTILSQNPAESHQMGSYTKSGGFICGICNRKFTKQQNLQAHVSRQHGPNPKTFKCDICGVFGFYQRELKTHIESVHSNIRKHKCNTCGKSFKYPHHLKDHITIHTGERAFKCLYEGCGKRFTTQTTKVRHERVHTGERPYVCEIDGCERSFTNSTSIKIHRHKEHGISALSYSCGICSKIFKIKSKLVKHIQEKHSSAIEE